MTKMRHFTVGLLLFTMMVGLYGLIYDGLQEGYDIEKGAVKTLTETGEEGNIIDQLRTINIIDAASDIQRAITTLKNPLNPLDVAGALITGGVGIGKLVVGLVTLPFEILSIIGEYYQIPGIIIIIINLIVGITLAFLLVSLYSRWEM